jgi:hypothetical protein
MSRGKRRRTINQLIFLDIKMQNYLPGTSSIIRLAEIA